MTSLDRAKQFLREKGRKLALTAVPLAALAIAAIPAHAATVTAVTGSGSTAGSIGPISCSASGGGGGFCTIVSQGYEGAASDLNWLQLFGNGSVSGGSITFENSGSSASGVLNPGTIGVSWDFTISGAIQATQLPTTGISVGIPDGATWTVFYGIETTGDGWVSGSESNTISSPATVTGSDSLIFNSGGTVEAFELGLTVSSPDSVSISIPGGETLDINPPSATPEPASLLLTVAGLTALGFLRRRRKNA